MLKVFAIAQFVNPRAKHNAFASAAETHIVQAPHANAKTKAYPNVSSRFSERVSLPPDVMIGTSQPNGNYED